MTNIIFVCCANTTEEEGIIRSYLKYKVLTTLKHFLKERKDIIYIFSLSSVLKPLS